MESQNQVEKKYQKLLHDVSTLEYYKIDLNNRVNCYKCACGHVTKTKDVDPGVTPFYFTCEQCGGMAQSTFYKDIATDKEPTFEWYRPTLKQVIKMRKNPSQLDHILKGGLDYRKVELK